MAAVIREARVPQQQPRPLEQSGPRRVACDPVIDLVSIRRASFPPPGDIETIQQLKQTGRSIDRLDFDAIMKDIEEETWHPSSASTYSPPAPKPMPTLRRARAPRLRKAALFLLGIGIGSLAALALMHRAEIVASADAMAERPEVTRAALTMVEWSDVAVSGIVAAQSELAASVRRERASHNVAVAVAVAQPTQPIVLAVPKELPAPASTPVLASSPEAAPAHVDPVTRWTPRRRRAAARPRTAEQAQEEPASGRSFYVATNLDGAPAWREQPARAMRANNGPRIETVASVTVPTE